MWQTSDEEHKSAGHASKFHQHDHAESLFVLAENEGLCFSGDGGCLDPNSMALFLPKHNLSPCFLCRGGQEKEYHIYNIYRCICVHAYLSVCVYAYVYIYTRIQIYSVTIYTNIQIHRTAMWSNWTTLCSGFIWKTIPTDSSALICLQWNSIYSIKTLNIASEANLPFTMFCGMQCYRKLFWCFSLKKINKSKPTSLNDGIGPVYSFDF